VKEVIRKKGLRSPIEGVVIRRLAGQSAAAKADALAENLAFRVVWPIATVFLLGIVELMRRMGTGLSFSYFALLVALAVCASTLLLLKGRRKVATWSMGACGERIVGQNLDREMPSRGYKVYHDIQIRKGRRTMNIDHLLVGPNGVFLIEDKTWSKPMKGQTIVHFDGRCVYRNGVPDMRPVKEAFALAREANSYIKSLTGVSVPIKPVLVFVGWYNQADNHHDSRLLVLSEKVLPDYIKNHQPQCVPSERDLRLIIAKLDVANGF